MHVSAVDGVFRHAMSRVPSFPRGRAWQRTQFAVQINLSLYTSDCVLFDVVKIVNWDHGRRGPHVPPHATHQVSAHVSGE